MDKTAGAAGPGDASPGKEKLRRKHSAEFIHQVEERQKKASVHRPQPGEQMKKVEEKPKPVPLQNGHNSVKEVPKRKERTQVKKKPSEKY